MADYTKGRIYKLDLTALQPDPAQARKYIDPGSLSELTSSIGKYGVLQPIISQPLSINKIPEDLRYQIRSNPNIPKTFLIDVAKLKTEQAMRTKFTKYIDKGQKAAIRAQTRPAARVSKAVALTNRMDSLHGELVNLAWQDWTDVEKEDLVNRLQDLRRGADDLLQQMDAPIDEREPENDLPGLA